jgi:Fe-S-cluster containining protein
MPEKNNPPGATCATCAAACCRLEVLLIGDNQVPDYLTREDRWGGTVMRQLADGWCAALDRESRQCTIYRQRPGVCRDYEMGVGDCLLEYVRR